MEECGIECKFYNEYIFIESYGELFFPEKISFKEIKQFFVYFVLFYLYLFFQMISTEYQFIC